MTKSSAANLPPRVRGKTSQKAPGRRTGGNRPRRAARLDPDTRKELILQSAADLVIRDGISNCSLEAVARAAGVSKPLVYKYYPNRESLLGALLQREFDFIRNYNADRLARAQAARSKQSVDTILRDGVHSYLQYLSERGSLFRMLVSDPGVVAQAQDVLRSGRGAVMRYWEEHLTAAFDLPPELIRVGVIMTSYAVEGAQGSIRSGKVEREKVADFWTVFVRAGWRAAAKKYGQKSLVKRSRSSPPR
jgi:AcrR family transcriptional regulator